MDSITFNQSVTREKGDTASIATKKETDTAVPEDKGSPENSEYDSADADSYIDEDENVKIRSRASNLDEHSDSDSLILEREEGDGQESVPTKKVDDDEDKKNPQYIPKRGTFYEHDDRTVEDGCEVPNEEEVDKDKDNKKKVWQDKKEKWSHDRFNEPEQAPKSRSELISIYGYDIRNEEGPPRARRRRKYGRGPNKYTRNWEDEDAYNKPPTVIKRGKKPLTSGSQEEFPPLLRNAPERDEEKYEVSVSVNNDQETQSRKVEPWNEPPKQKPIPQSSRAENSQNDANLNDNKGQRIGSGRISTSKETNESDYNGFTTKSRNARNRKGVLQKILPARNTQKEDFIQSQNFYLTNKNNELEKDMSKLNIDDGNGSKSKSNYNNSNNNLRQSSVPPRLQPEQKGSKRYSSIRQKSLPETNTPPLNNYATTFYPNDFNQQSVPSPTQPILHQSSQLLPSSTQVAHVTPLQPQVPVTAAPLLQAATFAPQAYPQPPPFIQPAAVAGPTFMPAPSAPQLINFVQSQPNFQANFQGYQQPFNSVNPPAELYQPQGGITYYSTDQQLAQRQVPLKRPKAAIPIVAPPAYDRKDDISNNTQIDNFEPAVETLQ